MAHIRTNPREATMDANHEIPDNGKEAKFPLTSQDSEIAVDMEESDFVDLKDVIEVKVDDDNVPMEYDDDDDDDEQQQDQLKKSKTVEKDMAKAKLESHNGPVYSVAAHYDPSTRSLSILSGGGDDKSFMHRIVQGSAGSTAAPTPSTVALSHIHSDTVSCAAFNVNFVSSDLNKTPKLAAVGSYDGSIVIYDFETANKRMELEGPSDVEWLCFHPKGGSVLLAGSVTDGTVWMYHIPTSKCMQVFVGHESGVTAGSFSPDGRWALSASSDGSIRLWAPRTGVSKHVFRLGEAGLTSLAVNGGTDSQLVVVGAEDGMAHVCHIGTKKVVATLRHFEPPLSSNPDEDEEMELPMSVEAVGFASSSVNPNWVATGGVDGVLKIWDLANDGQCRQVCRHGSEVASDVGGITRLRWHPALPLVFASSSDGNVRIWDARNGCLVKTLTGHSDMVNDLDVTFIDPENEGGIAIIVSGSDDKTVRIYEVDMKEALLSTVKSTSSDVDA